MTAERDPGRRLAEHLRFEAQGRAPDWLLESTLAIIDTTPQRRGLRRLPWRFPIVNTFAKLAVAAVAVIVGAVALTTLSGARLPAVGGPGPAVVSPAPTPSPTPTPAPSPSPVPSQTTVPTVGSVTLSATGCAWAGDTSALSSGPIQIEATNATQSDAGFALYLVAPGHTYQELATIIEGYDAQAQQDPQNVQISVPETIAIGHGVIGILRPGATASLASDIPSGSVAGIACWRGDPAANAVNNVYSVGPLEFR
jgi:hypothetical protein